MGVCIKVLNYDEDDVEYSNDKIQNILNKNVMNRAIIKFDAKEIKKINKTILRTSAKEPKPNTPKQKPFQYENFSYEIVIKHN